MRAPHLTVHPLSSSQREIWFDQMLHEGVALYNIGGWVDLPGEIDVEMFRTAVQMLVRRHDALRLVLMDTTDEDGMPLQKVVEPWAVEVALHDFSGEAEPRATAQAWMQARFEEPFTLIRQPLWRYDLVKMGPAEYGWLLQYHHLIVDGWAIAMINRSLAEIYSSLAEQAWSEIAPSQSYTAFIASDREYVESPAFERDRAYWLAQYADGAPEPLLQARHHATAPKSEGTAGSAVQSMHLPRAMYRELEALAAEQGASVFHVLLGVLYVYFTRTGQREDFAVGLPVLNRSNAQMRATAGLFVGVTPAHFNFGREITFVELIQKIGKTLKGHYRHQRFPVSEVSRAVGLQASRSALFDVTLSFENSDNDMRFGKVTGQLIPVLNRSAQAPLTVFVRDFHDDHDVQLDFVHNLAYLDETEVQALRERFQTILAVVLHSSGQTAVQSFPVMTVDEVQQLQLWNQTEADYPADLTVVDLFEAQVDKTPDATAVVFEGQALSYAQLDQRSNQVAHALVEQGVGPDTLVGLCVPRSLEMVVGILGILKAGGAYVPLDSDYPADRLAFMVQDAKAPVVLSHSAVLDRLPQSNAAVLRLDAPSAWAAQPITRPARRASPDDLAYVIYTSGSTGVPKGSALCHAGWTNLLTWYSTALSLTPQDRTLIISALGFDLTQKNILTPLLVGAGVCLPPAGLYDPEVLRELIEQHRITWINCTPSAFEPLLTAGATRTWQYLDSLRWVVLGGEPINLKVLKPWLQVSAARLMNSYGPTECTDVDVAHVIENLDAPSVSIGRPIGNTRVYILDGQLNLVPPGVPGELCIAGAGLARGYLNRPELTAEKFISAEVLGRSERLYRTGDLARWGADGNLEYLGRLDHQVKLRGFRIELGEIESALSAHEAVSAAAVVLREREGVKALAGYVVLRSAVEVSELKTWLKAHLPEYMVPASVTVLECLPLTPNGKVDRRALPEPELAVSVGRALSGPTEELLGAIWAEVLGLAALSAEAHFFELGGHSLLATRVASRIRAQLGVECPLRVLFEQPVLADLAAWLDAQQRGSIVELIEPLPAGAELVLSPAQERLWFLAQLEGDSATYNMPAALRLSGELDEAALRVSLTALTERQASLRQSFPVEASGQARLAERAPWDPLELTDLQHLAPEAQEAEVERLARAHAQTPFDLAAGPLFRVGLLRLGVAEHVLLLNLHHSIGDGWSIAVLVREWAELYRAARAGQAPALTPLPIAYRDVAAWQQRWSTSEAASAQLAWWVAQLQGAPALLELPTDFPRPAQQSYRGTSFARTLDPALSQAVERLARAQGATVFMTLLGALQLVLHRHSGQSDISVGTPVANREHAQTEHLVGLFVNTLVIRSQLDPQQPFADLLAQVRHTSLGAFARQALPFERVVEALSPERSLAHAPLFQVMFVLQNNDSADFELDGLQISPVAQASSVAKVDLTLSAQQTPAGILCHWEFAQDLFTQARVERLARHFEQVLQTVTRAPEQPLHAIDILTPEDKAQLLAWNQTEQAYPADLTVVDLFEAQVDQSPDATAVVFEGQALSYAQLDKQANQVAHALIEQGVGADTLVGLCVPRSLDMVVGLLGILKAGGAYVPLDPDYPPDRLAFMVQDSNAPVVLTHSAVLDRLPQSEATVLGLDDANAWAAQPDTRPARRSSPSDLAYVIYTSGSTGTPKGVLLQHGSAVNLALAQIQAFDTGPGCRVLQFAAFSFDAAAWEVLMALGSGGALHVVPSQFLREDLFAVLQQQAITHVTLPPSMLAVLPSEQLPALHTLVVAGEACPPALLPAWAVGRLFCNAYGPTETTVCATIAPCTAEMAQAPIGKPIANTRVYILDEHQRVLPPGVPGELCIAGAGLARGYLNRPELTAEKFISAEVLGRSERLYRTGDLARWGADGNLEYLGRLDHQVKLRGFRIELGEIESALSAHEAVSAAAVVLREREGTKVLAGYVVLRATADTSELKAWLKSRLPEYMVPASLTVLEALPLTPNGKVDRRALPEPDLAVSTDWSAPRSAAEQTLCAIWSAVLRRSDIGIHDNFFDLGGDSILSIQIVARARQAGLGLSARDVFEHQSVAELAQVVRAVRDLDAPQGAVRGPVPLTPIQARFFEAARPAPWHFNQAMLLRVPLLQERALRSALAAVLAHHDALRLRYTLDATTGEWLQSHAEVEPESAAPLHVEDLDVPDTTDAIVWEAALQARADHWQASLDLASGPLTRLVLLRCPGAPERTRLLWVIHHLAVDGVSWRILLEDLQRAYGQAAAGEPAALPAKTSSFQGWSTRLQRWGQSAAFADEAALWQDRPALPALRADHPAGAADEALTAWQTFTLDADLTAELLHQVPAAFRTGIQDVLVSALALALNERGGQTRLRLDLESHGRAELFADIDLGRTVGWFTSLYSVEVDLSAAKGSGQVLLAIKEALRAIPHEGLACGVLDQQGQRVPHSTVLFNYLGQFDQMSQEDSAGGWALAREGSGQSIQPGGQRSHLLAINGSITHGQLSLAFDYSSAQLEAASIEALIESYGRHLRALITHCRDHFGLSPSDFALAGLDQPSLDRLSRDHGRALETLYPLSPMQHGMLFHSLVAPGSGAYITQMSLGLSRVEPAHLKAAWQGLVERHAILRSAVRHDVQPPVQVVLARVELPWCEVEARDLDAAAQQALVEELLQDDRRDFDFAQAPLMRLSLVHLGQGHIRLLWSNHHLLMDGWCLPILFQELFALYEASRLGQPSALPPVQRYQHYIAWIARQDQEQARAHWRERLLGFDTPTPVTIARHVPADVPKQPHDIALTLDQPASAELQRWARSQRLTLNAVVLGAWATLLGRYAGTDDVVFGATTSGRNVPLPGIEHMVGLFINTLPLRASLRSTALELARTLQAQQQADNAFAYSSLADIQTASDIPAGASLFDTLVVFENYPVDEALKDQRSQPFGLDDIQAQEGTNYALTLAVLPGQALGFKLSFDAARVEPAAAQRLLSHFAQIVRAFTVTPELPAQALEILTPEDKAQLQLWNQTDTDYPADLTVVDLFEAQVDQSPEATAVVFEGQALSYAQLDKQANQVAHALITQGVGPDTLVGLCVPRSLEMVVGLLGILKAGAAYVPLDPDYPQERLAFMVQDSNAPVLLSHGAVLDRLPESAATVLRLDEPSAWAAQPITRPARRASPDDLAYVIYTSGSTGTPKGCLMTHANISRLFSVTKSWFHFGPTDTWTLFHSYAFDFSVWEIWGPLAHGGRLVIVPYLVSRSPDLFRQLLLDEQVTVLNQTPSAFLQFIQADAACASEPFALKWIIFGGEALELASLRPWFERHGDVQPQLVNMYGITETTVHVTYHALDRHSVTRGSSVIGRAIPDLRIYLLDRHLNPVPPGVDGEMHVAGAGLARGYLNRPELTAEKFITAEVLGRSERLYRTGDLARWLPDGNLEYLGRLDHQVKLRGFRIELGEIESALSAHEAVSAAAVVLREREGVKALAGYVVLRSAVEVSELKVWLKARLPEYMVPASVTVLEALPLTPNGKVDRRALPEPDQLSGSRYLAPRTLTEVHLTRLWEDVLGVCPISIDASFFDLGGHSLLAIRLLARVQQHFGQALPLATLFRSSTIAQLAEHLDAPPLADLPRHVVPIQPTGHRPALYCLPGAGGQVLYFHTLARHIGAEQPVFGLQTPGLDPGERLPDSVETHAHQLVTALRTHQPEGPYRLLGHSSGARVAFEMTHQLEEQGQRVTQLILLDATPSTPESARQQRQSHSSLERMMDAIESLEAAFEQSLDLSRTVLELLPDEDNRWQCIVQRLWQRQILPASVGVEQVRTMFRVWETAGDNHERYQPGARVQAPVWVLRASDRHDDTPAWLIDDAQWDWQPHAQLPVQVQWVAGNHDTMLNEPQVRELAGVIRQVLGS